MKKLTDYYVLITENIVDEVIEYFNLHKDTKHIVGQYLQFEYDDFNSYYFTEIALDYQTKLKWSKMKRFIDNSPTREKYLSAQQQSKGYKKCWLEEKQRRELLGQNFDNLHKEYVKCNSNLKEANSFSGEKIKLLVDYEYKFEKLENRIDRLVTERDVLVKLAKENGITNTQDLTDWVKGLLEINKSNDNIIERYIKLFSKYLEILKQIEASRNRYRNKSQSLQEAIKASNFKQEFLNQENKRLKRRNRILTIGFILSASFYLIASIF